MAFDAIIWAKLKQCASLKDGKIPSEQLPSYIDDVIEVASYANLPRPGEKSKIYYTLDTQRSYRWGSSTYILVTSGNFDELATVEDIADFITEADVDAKIRAIKIPEPDLSNYFTKEETRNQFATKQYVQDAISTIELPDVSNFITIKDVENKNYLTEIPEIYVTEAELEAKGFITDSDNFATRDEVADAISSIKIPEVNLDSYATHDWVNEQNFAKASDIPSDYITEIPNEYVTNTELSDAIAAIQIPDVSEFVTKEYVDTAIENIDSSSTDVSELITKDQLASALSAKADDVLFTDNYIVGLPDGLGNFKNGDSVKNLTLREIIIRMLNLSINDAPEDPAPDEVTIDNIKPIYYLKNGSSEVSTMSKDSAVVITDNTASSKDAEGLFSDDNGNVGYQLQYAQITDDPIPKLYLDPSYTLKAVQVFDVTNNTWVDSDYMFDPVWVWEESPTLETVKVDGKDVELKVYTYNFDETDEVGSTEYRFVVDLVK